MFPSILSAKEWSLKLSQFFSTPANQFLLLLLQFLSTGLLTPVSLDFNFSSTMSSSVFLQWKCLQYLKYTLRSLYKRTKSKFFPILFFFFFSNRISSFPASFEILVANRLSKPFYPLDLCSLSSLLLRLSSFPCVLKLPHLLN